MSSTDLGSSSDTHIQATKTSRPEDNTSTSAHPPSNIPDPSSTSAASTSNPESAAKPSKTVGLTTTPVVLARQDQDHSFSHTPDTESSSAKNPDTNSSQAQGPETEKDDNPYPAHDSKSTPHAASTPQLSSLTLNLSAALRQYPEFPSPGILFEDICPIFSNPSTLKDLITALQLFIAEENGGPGIPDVIVGLDARGFLMGPALALQVGAGFVPVRKKGKLPGKVERVTYKKEYGEDVFEIQADAVKKGQKVLVIDDIIATGGSAAAAGELVRRLGGDLIGFVFLLELEFLKGREKLDAKVWTLLTGQKKDAET